MKSKVIILKTAGGELANQLWNAASIYAYALECGYAFYNPAFFEYGLFFRFAPSNVLLKMVFFLPFKNYTQRKNAFLRRVGRKLYEMYTNIVTFLFSGQIISWIDQQNRPFYLSPTQPPTEILGALERAQKDIYFDGWLFRNPIGLKKYHQEIRMYFEPREDIQNRVTAHVQALRLRFVHLVGVHIRQGDYQVWREGKYFLDQKRVKKILEEYLDFFDKSADTTCFVLTSDGAVDEAIFSGLNVLIRQDIAVADLFLLASTDRILGSESTFGAFAGYYGDIPFIVMQHEKMDWEYYKHKERFFEGKYSTMVHY